MIARSICCAVAMSLIGAGSVAAHRKKPPAYPYETQVKCVASPIEETP